MDLVEWTVNYVKNKDILQRKLLDTDIESHIIHFTFKDKKHDYLVEEVLTGTSHEAEYVTFVCLCVQENFDYLMKNWNDLARRPNVNFIFVNPRTNNKWIINPHIHSKIADPESLELGLKSMFEQAEAL